MVKRFFTVLLILAAVILVPARAAFADDSGWEMVTEAPDDDPFIFPEEPEMPEEGSLEQEEGPEEQTGHAPAEEAEAGDDEGHDYIDEDTTWLRIGLKYGDTAAVKSVVSCDDGFVLVSFNGNKYEVLEDLTEHSSLTASCADGKILLFSSEGEELALLEPSMALMSASESPDDRIITIDGSKYRDAASYRLTGSSMSVINRITLEHYLWGVIANEMGYLYPQEALKAQAVTARSYALNSISKHGTYGFDLCTGQNCQVYRGVASERSETVTACKETEGEVLKYQGRTVSGYYYAYSWGYTMDSDDVWVTQPGYLYGVEDEYVQEYMWKTSFTFDQLKARMDALGYNGGNITSVSVMKRADNNAVAALNIKTDTISFVITKSNITGLLSSLGVKSLCFYVDGSDYPAKGTEKRGSIYAVEDFEYTAEDRVWVAGSDGEVSEISASDVHITNGRETVPAFTLTVSGFTDGVADGGMVYLTGFGYGHGVGMPQTSAKNMANAGYDYEEILKYYYKGIEIKQYSQRQ